MKQFEYKTSYKVKKKMPLERRIQGREKIRELQLRNVVTGKVDAADWYRAMGEIKAIKPQLSARSGELDWEQQGPDQVGGRTRGFVFDKLNPNRVYAGGVSGGVYVSDNLGHNWRPVQDMSDSFHIMSIGCMKQSKDGDIYAGTGEYWGNPVDGSGGSQFYGNGIYKKKANEETWTLLTSTVSSLLTNASNNGNFQQVIDIACDPNDNEKIYAGTTKGLFVSTNGGQTWTSVPGVSSPVAQIKYAADGSTLYGAWNGKVWKSTNGTTWTDLIGANTAYQANGNQHVRIAVSSKDPNKLYVAGITGSNGGDLKYAIRTTDGGSTWQFLGKGDISFNPLCNDVNGQRQCQGFYDLSLATHPLNDDIVFMGGSASMYSWSTQYGWVQMTYGYSPGVLGINQVHADMHEFAFHPTHPDTMVVCNDGGVYMSYNSLSKFPNVTWTPQLAKYNITQFYDIAVNIYGELVGGAQDNGTQFVTLRGANNNLSFEISGGDGFDCEISAANDNMVAFTTVYSGALQRTSDLSTKRESIATGCAASASGGTMQNVGFHTRIHLSESRLPQGAGLPDTVEKSFLFCFNAAGQFTVSPNAYNVNEGTTWIPWTSPGIGEIYSAHQSKNLDVIYLCGASGMKMSTKFRDIVWSLNANASTTPCLNAPNLSWTPVSGVPGSISDVYVDQTDNKIVVAVQFGFGGTAKVFYTTNGTSFVAKQGNLPIMPVYSCAIDPDDSKHVVVGTEFGIWETEDITASSPTWREANKTIGRVPVFKLRVSKLREEGCTVLYAGSHGRGFFRVPFPFKSTCDYTKKARPISSGIDPVINLKTEFNIYPNPVSENVNVTFNSKVIANYTLSIYDMNGRVVKRMNYRANSGDNVIKSDISSLQNGNYIVRLEDNNNVIGGKIMTKN